MIASGLKKENNVIGGEFKAKLILSDNQDWLEGILSTEHYGDEPGGSFRGRRG